ncbi:hypothetical protein [Streptacidiphilus sp. EB129]|jgi:hypothetical protein|uniref:hypothetical protein n=1 Tax=Streptacidiphilus sp. EB129 TaxID=3156262 RepID=UPI0035158991
MDSAPYLHAEDKLDYERIVEELLHNEQVRAALRRTPGGLNAEQLHTRAMTDLASVSAVAASEYTYFVELREQARRSMPVPDWERVGGDDPAQWQGPDNPLAAAERAGWVPLIAVLLPILSGLSALVLLLLGYSFRADGMSLGQQLVTAGLVAAVVCAASIAADIIGLLLTAARDASTPPEGRNPELYAELATARETWHSALRDRALLPYLLAQLGTTPRASAPRPTGVSLVRQRPRLGFTSPGFTSPGAERITNDKGQDTEPDEEGEPHFSSPGFTSPGPERITDERGEEVKPTEESEPQFTSPGFTSPGYDSPGPIEPRTGAGRNGTATVPTRRSRFLPNSDDPDAEET